MLIQSKHEDKSLFLTDCVEQYAKFLRKLNKENEAQSLERKLQHYLQMNKK